MGRRKSIPDKTKKAIFKMILAGVKPSDIKEHFNGKGTPISLQTIHIYKGELKEELKKSGSPVIIPAVFGRRRVGSDQVAQSSVQAVTGKLPKGEIFKGNSIHIKAKKYKVFLNDMPIHFSGVPESLIFENDKLVVVYPTYHCKITF